MRIFHKTPDEIEKLRAVNLIVSAVLDACEAACKPGATTWAELTTSAGKVVYNSDVGPAPYPPRKTWTEKHTVTLSLD